MGMRIEKAQMKDIWTALEAEYDIYAPKVFEGEACFSDQDSLRYGKVHAFEEVEFEKKSEYSFKEVILPIQQNLFYYTEDKVNVPEIPDRGILLFLRSCDIHALKRLDEMYLNNGPADYYYKRLRDRVRIVLIGCESSCESGFCVTMGTNRTDAYDLYMKPQEKEVLVEIRNPEMAEFFKNTSGREADASPDFVTENIEKVTLPGNLGPHTVKDPLWEEYNARCIACGRCNFVCPTCTCFTMQDIAYKENPKAGERRRVWSSCMVDGFTAIAGGIEFRKTKGERMRFKVMHKIYDYEKRFGYPMCVGCGRCDDVCPEYISYSHIINRLAKEEA